MDPDVRDLPDPCPVCSADVTEILDSEGLSAAGDVREILCANGHRLHRQGSALVEVPEE